jgi:RNA polymerase sigma-70 factor (ECF subfamily)
VALRDQLDRGFQRLSPEQRVVIVLHHYLGLSQTESAEALAIPLGTLQSRLGRATQAMRAALDADERPAVGAVEVAR